MLSGCSRAQTQLFYFFKSKLKQRRFEKSEQSCSVRLARGLASFPPSYIIAGCIFNHSDCKDDGKGCEGFH